MTTKTTANHPANDNAQWTSAAWQSHIAQHHPAHAAASFAKHREEMGRLAPAAKVITALTMTGRLWQKSALSPLTYAEAMEKIDDACAARAAKRAA